MIELKNVCKSIGEKKVLVEFSHTFKPASRTCIMGASGSGKTTVLNILLGIVKPDSGIITGVPDNISAVFQEDRLCEPYSAVENVFAVTGNEVSEDKLVSLLGELELSGNEHLPVHTLSGGMKRRVAIARALAGNPSLILADEPTGNLDSKTGADVMKLLHELHEAGNTIVLITHDAKIAAQTPRSIHIHDGKVIEPMDESEVVI